MKTSLNTFTKNIILVFTGSSLVNLINLLCQLFIAHKFTLADFSAFNSLLSVFTVASIPLLTIQTAVAKYSAEFYASHQTNKVRLLISSFFKKGIFLAALTLPVFYYFSVYIIRILNIHSPTSVYILSLLLAVCWIMPVLLGGTQGLEFFGWFISASLANAGSKFVLTLLFIVAGLGIAGALGAFLCANLLTAIILIFPLSNFITFRQMDGELDYKQIFSYLIPIAISLFCFTVLVNTDMILVRYFFSPQDSGFYSIAQMIGKIFLFLPAAISIALLPRASALHAKSMNTMHILRHSLFYAFILCVSSLVIYNIFPEFVLKVLTGKCFDESIRLGRLFGISMSFFALSYILITYFLSRRDLRFIKYLVFFTLLEVLAIVFLHRDIFIIQFILCVNAILLFLVNIRLAFKKLAYT